jgi:hypothetical protein
MAEEEEWIVRCFEEICVKGSSNTVTSLSLKCNNPWVLWRFRPDYLAPLKAVELSSNVRSLEALNSNSGFRPKRIVVKSSTPQFRLGFQRMPQMGYLKELVVSFFPTSVLVFSYAIPGNLKTFELISPDFGFPKTALQLEKLRNLVDSSPGLRIFIRTREVDHAEAQFWRTLPRVSVHLLKDM